MTWTPEPTYRPPVSDEDVYEGNVLWADNGIHECQIREERYIRKEEADRMTRKYETLSRQTADDIRRMLNLDGIIEEFEYRQKNIRRAQIIQAVAIVFLALAWVFIAILVLYVIQDFFGIYSWDDQDAYSIFGFYGNGCNSCGFDRVCNDKAA